MDKKNMPARKTLVQRLVAYTNPEGQNAQRHRQTDGQTDGQQAAANSRSYCGSPSTLASSSK